MDDQQDTGLSGWAWYEMGRASAEDAAAERRAVRSVFNNRRSKNVVDSVLAQNQALLAENAQLRQDLAAYRLNYGNLKAWANRAEAEINQLKQERG